MKAGRYQDYVIKDGKFIGKFEEMYQEFDNPWHQAEATQSSYSRCASIVTMRNRNIRSVVEFGCGLGYYTAMIHRQAGIRITGVDISRTAIKKARAMWPGLDFAVDTVKNIGKYSAVDAILFAEITWYILEDLQEVFKAMLEHFRGKHFLHNLVFYKGQQKYGNEFFTNLEEFIAYVPFQLVARCEADTSDGDCVETSSCFRIVEK